MIKNICDWCGRETKEFFGLETHDYKDYHLCKDCDTIYLQDSEEWDKMRNRHLDRLIAERRAKFKKGLKK